MLIYILATFCIVSVKGYSVLDDNYKVLNSETDKLRWPETYTIKAVSYSLTNNIVEDFTAWRTNQSSRIDFNKGAVKKITKLSLDWDSEGNQFEIHPETTEEELNKIVCHESDGWWDAVELDQILPELSDDEDFEVVGNEIIDDIETVKFEYTEKDLLRKMSKTIWAFYSDDAWVPVRYEVVKYNVRLGSLTSHIIWTFSDYSAEIEDDSVFDATQFNCESDSVKHTPDSEKITKELLFINPENEKHVDHVYNHFQNKHEREIAHKHEHAMRKDLFRENMKMISSVNRRNLGYTLAINQFSDWTDEELEQSQGTIPRPEGLTGTVAFPYDESKVNDIAKDLPQEYDMRLYGLISSVKSQGTCGSCWTFAASAVIESALARHNGGKVLDLSNQAIMDCAYDTLGGRNRGGGCHGGFDFVAYDFVVKHGLPTEEEYGPYKNQDDYCRIYNMTKTYPITGYTDVTLNSPNAMKVAVVNHGPLYVAVHVSREFYFYSSGIFYQSKEGCPENRANHAVTLIGYGERDGNLYWIIKNSWGAGWGVDGYMLASGKDNVCGVASRPTYPVF